MQANKLLSLKQRHLMPCLFHFYKEPMALVRGEGAWLFDAEGKRYLDAYSGVGTVNCGHCPPEIVGPTVAQAATLQHTTTIYLTEPMMLLAERLAAFAPPGITRSFFCPSGSEANEGALLLAKLATRRRDFVALSRSLHGRTHLTAGVTGMAFWRTDPDPPDHIHFAPSPHCLHCPLEQTHPGCNLACADAVEDILRQHPVAAMIAEPIHGNGGIVVPPPGYWPKVKGFLEAHGALLIMDEAQTGFCRTGTAFASEGCGVVPEIMTVCKALGNGLPIAAFMASEAVAACYNKPGASTFGGNLVTCRAALATLDYLERHQLAARATAMGAMLMDQLEAVQRRFPQQVAEVRGRGLMLGMEITPADGDAGLVDRILESLKDQGILIGKTGPDRNVLTFMPPLIIDREQVQLLVNGLTTAMEDNV